MVASVEVKLMQVTGLHQGFFQCHDAFQFAVIVARIHPQTRSGFFRDGRDQFLDVGRAILEYSRGMQPQGTEQLGVFKPKLDRPAAATGQATQGSVVAVCKGAIVRIHIWDDQAEQTNPKPGSGIEIPISVIREDNNERKAFS